ncbi:unnamed protein product [Effrenium voratum]|nr:unnamed protein product [Effrenium voratum]
MTMLGRKFSAQQLMRFGLDARTWQAWGRESPALVLGRQALRGAASWRGAGQEEVQLCKHWQRRLGVRQDAEQEMEKRRKITGFLTGPPMVKEVIDEGPNGDSSGNARWKLSFCSPEEDHGVEVGDLLITHPLSGLFQEPFDQAVILVVKISRDAELVQGLVLNKEPTENVETLAQLLVDKSASLLTSSWNGAAFRDLPLLEQPLLPGGPTLHGRLEDDLFWLHCHTDVPGATGLRLGLACGGDLAAARAGGGGLRVFRGSACWDRRQLQLEKQRGVWVHARAGFHKGGQEALRQLAMGEASNGWRRALRAAGLPALANFPRGDVDRLLKDYVGSHQRALAMKN